MSLAINAENLASTLYTLLGDLEPARWRDEKRRELAHAFERLSDGVDNVLRDWPDAEELSAVRARLDEVRSVIDRELPTADDLRTRWMEFRTEVHGAYEGLADALKACHVELPSVRPTNYARSGFHVLAGIIALLVVQFLPWVLVLAIPGALCLVAWTLEISRRFSDRWNDRMMRLFSQVAHPHERYRVNSSTWFLTALTFLATLGHPIPGAMAVMVLGFGDPAAALIGRRWGRTKLVNNRSLEGTVAFALVAFLACIVVLGIFHGDLAATTMLLIAALAAVVGALVELFSRRIDDNFAIPVAVGGCVWVTLPFVV